MDPQARQMLQMHRDVNAALNLGLPDIPWIPALLAAGLSLTAIGFAVDLYRKSNPVTEGDEASAAAAAAKKKKAAAQMKAQSASALRRQRLRARRPAAGGNHADSQTTADSIEHDTPEVEAQDPFAGLSGEQLLEALLLTGQTLKEAKKLAEARETYERANAVCEELARQNPTHAIAYRSLGIRTLASLLTTLKDFQGALKLHEELLQMGPPEPDRSELALTCVDLNILLQEFEKADQCALDVLERLKEIRGPQERMAIPLQYKTLVKLGVTRLRLRKLSDSEDFLVQALALARRRENREMFIGALLEPTSALIEVLLEDGKVTEACNVADALAEEQLESGYPKTTCLRVLIQVFYNKGFLDITEKRLLQLLELVGSKENSETWGIHNKLIGVLRETNRHVEALTYVESLRTKGQPAALVTHSLYLSTKTAGVYFETEKPMKAPKLVECWFQLVMELRDAPTNTPRRLPAGCVLECSFENLHMADDEEESSKSKGKGEAQTSLTCVDVTLTEEMLKNNAVRVKSPRFCGADRGSYFIFVTVYADENKQKVIAHHHQMVFCKLDTDTINSVEDLQLRLEMA
eukprot:CAMPEP_0174236178 /NCGR_PEP_ID=MMETSP0417-20130205/5389_1 /TAXON_ID=242541 /ORGANISM="Mayorella sp, Strain BSH-02190019" /LENGTH=579 /DNA_ID=CAMNT_0015314783 /DNA_START=106 /DNA_END=1842 /DNA_ORIENTATION=+